METGAHDKEKPATLFRLSYEGEWLNGQQVGRGTLTFADGRQYIGDWNGGARHGHGVMRWPDGREYFGGIETPR